MGKQESDILKLTNEEKAEKNKERKKRKKPEVATVPGKCPKQPKTLSSEQKYEIEGIIEERKVGRRKEYKVRYKNYGPVDDEWVPTSGLNQVALTAWKQRKEREAARRSS
jgi:hypothetical protein